MRSVADGLRADTRRAIAEQTPDARVRTALELGDADVAALCEARGLSVAEARAVITDRRRAGRRSSMSDGD